MRPLFIPVALVVLFLAAGCSDAEPQTLDLTGEDETAAATDEATGDGDSPGSDSEDAVTVADDGGASPFYFDGTTRADLPADLDERVDLMSQWLDVNRPDESSGYGYGVVDDRHELTFSLNVSDPSEAAARCETYQGLAEAYFFDVQLDPIILEGWVLGADGSYGPSEWENIVCP